MEADHVVAARPSMEVEVHRSLHDDARRRPDPRGQSCPQPTAPFTATVVREWAFTWTGRDIRMPAY
jgi:hypothetical protein